MNENKKRRVVIMGSCETINHDSCVIKAEESLVDWASIFDFISLNLSFA